MPPQNESAVVADLNPEDFSFAEDLTFDLHDLSAILLRERLLTEPRFRHARLLEVSDGSAPASCLPSEMQLDWMNSQVAQRKAGYFLKLPSCTPEDDLPIEPHNFLHPECKSPRVLDKTDVETIYWRVKHHDSGYTLAHAMQIVLDALPESTSIRIRTSEGYAITCKSAGSFTVAEMDVVPKSAMYVCSIEPKPDISNTHMGLSQYPLGLNYESVPWVYLIFGEEDVTKEDLTEDGRVMLDLVSPMLGMRGLGGETFSMERIKTYHDKILSACAYEDVDVTQSERINARDPQKGRVGIDLANRVLSRLANISRGEETYCAYCGKAAPKAQCSRCSTSRYCNQSCQLNTWKYHKVWCKSDAAAKTARRGEDITMKNV